MSAIDDVVGVDVDVGGQWDDLNRSLWRMVKTVWFLALALLGASTAILTLAVFVAAVDWIPLATGVIA